ncbi:MAG: hypothetical protein KDD82_16970 [Planctomycetes bacterium]|nr:hypothetical protein [Planctomycetota bacterium]
MLEVAILRERPGIEGAPLALRARGSARLRCAYCHDLVRAETPGCLRCGTRLHGHCWEEAGGCPTLGCRPATCVAKPTLGWQPPPPPTPAPEARWIHPGSVLSGSTGALVCAVSAFVAPAFGAMYAEVGIPLSPSTELLVSVPPGVWWTLYLLSIGLLVLKDRWILPSARQSANWLYAAGCVVVGSWILVSLFTGCVQTISPL